MKPEVLLRRDANLSLEPLSELGGEGLDIGIEISGPLVVNALAGDLIFDFCVADAPGDGRENRRIEAHRKKSRTSMS